MIVISLLITDDDSPSVSFQFARIYFYEMNQLTRKLGFPRNWYSTTEHK